MEVYSDDYFMTRALDLAMQAYGEQEVPIGAVVVHNNKSNRVLDQCER